MTTPGTAADSRAAGADGLLRDYHDARRREDQWRIPQLLTALVAPIAALISVLFGMSGKDGEALASGAVAVVTGLAAALLTVEVWRWHRTAIGLLNRFRTDHPADVALLLKDPI